MAIKDWGQKIKAEFMNLGRFLRETIVWFFRPRHTWLLVLALIITFGIIVFFSCSEPTIRLVGLGLQLVGFTTVGWELIQARKQFGKPTILGSFAQWLAQRPKFRAKHQLIGVDLATFPPEFFKPRLRQSPGPDTPLEEQVAMLRRQYESLFDEVGTLANKLDQNKAELSKRIDDEAATRREADARNQQQLEEATVGGLHLDWVGVTLFVLGSITGSASVELSSFLVASCSAA